VRESKVRPGLRDLRVPRDQPGRPVQKDLQGLKVRLGPKALLERI
jgi:hypothetical protein